jgi:hypothetical protein
MKIFKFMLTLCLLAQSALAAIEGRILDPSGNPVSLALVSVSDQTVGTYSDREGRFVLADVNAPVTIAVFSQGLSNQGAQDSEGIDAPYTDRALDQARTQ